MLVVALCLVSAALVLVAVLLVRQQQITTRLRHRRALVEGGSRVYDEEIWHLITATMPAIVESGFDRPVEVPGLLYASTAGTECARAIAGVREMFGESINRVRNHADQSAKATLRAMMRAVQSLANEQQLAISHMQERHDNPYVLEDLLGVDHLNAQLGRRAQVTAILCGSWPGQQRGAASLTDVVRGATSRIRDYLRVEVNSQMNMSVDGRAVEPVVLAVAELLDNAARHSQPNSTIEVNFRQAHNGVAIMIDDAGVAMTADELQQAATLLSGNESVDINRLGDPPRVGFAVAGALAARYGFSVSVDSRSPYGGVRAVVFLPTTLLARTVSPVAAAPAAGDAPARAGRPAAPSPPPAARPASEADAPAAPFPAPTTGGLPRRRRTSPLDQPLTADEVAPPAREARETAAGLGAWQRGSRSGRAVQAIDPEGNTRG